MDDVTTTPVPTQTASSPSPGRVLLVEDDADQRGLMAWMLRAEGLEVLEAESGIELLEWVARATSAPGRRCFDVIVSDVNMPDLTAMEVLAGWRAGWPVPLILATASADPTLRVEADALGAVTVLAKPIQRDDLRRALAGALRPHADA